MNGGEIRAVADAQRRAEEASSRIEAARKSMDDAERQLTKARGDLERLLAPGDDTRKQSDVADTAALIAAAYREGQRHPVQICPVPDR